MSTAHHQGGQRMDALRFVDVPPTTLRAIAERHGLRATTFARMPQVGIINTIYALGDDYVLRIPRDQPGTIAQARVEAVAAPAAREVGARTPRLVAYEETSDLIPVPYQIFERVPGRTLGLLDWEPVEIAALWRELGRDLARLHTIVPATAPLNALPLAEVGTDPRELAEERAR